MTDPARHIRENRRFRRQIDVLLSRTPRLRRAVQSLIHGKLRLLRIPVALVMLVGGLLGFLPVLGFWMVPLGLMLLAVDVPALRPVVSMGVVRLRRRMRQLIGPSGRLARLGAWLGRHP